MNLRDILNQPNPGDHLRALSPQKLRKLSRHLADLDMAIPSTHNHKDILQHSIQVLDNAIAREHQPDIVLRTAALFHDVGKPRTRRLHPDGTVSFGGHENYEADMMSSVLQGHGYFSAEVRDIKLLVRLHIRTHGQPSSWSDIEVRRLIADARTPENLERLLVLFYSDVTTKNPARRRSIHRSIDLLYARIAEVQAKGTRSAGRTVLDGNEVMKILKIGSGPELSKVMRVLNSERNLTLTKQEAVSLVKKEYGSLVRR